MLVHSLNKVKKQERLNMNFKSIEQAKQIIVECKDAIIEFENRIKNAEEYIKKNTITEDDIYPGACFVFVDHKNDTPRHAIPMVVIQQQYNKELYVLGGNGGDPFNLYWTDLYTKKELVEYFNGRHKDNIDYKCIKYNWSVKFVKD